MSIPHVFPLNKRNRPVKRFPACQLVFSQKNLINFNLSLQKTAPAPGVFSSAFPPVASPQRQKPVPQRFSPFAGIPSHTPDSGCSSPCPYFSDCPLKSLPPDISVRTPRIDCRLLRPSARKEPSGTPCTACSPEAPMRLFSHFQGIPSFSLQDTPQPSCPFRQVVLRQFLRKKYAAQ